MATDDYLLRKAEAAAARLAALERGVGAATVDYHRAVRRLHVAGTPMREIAEALQLSHQRVHQIVEAGNGPRRRWKLRTRTREKLECSFCERSSEQVRQLVAGSAAYVCGECVVAAEGNHFDPVHSASTLRCSFCGKDRKRGARMIAGPNAQICGECLVLCKEICAEN